MEQELVEKEEGQPGRLLGGLVRSGADVIDGLHLGHGDEGALVPGERQQQHLHVGEGRPLRVGEESGRER
eukprot:9172748-Prorocentrum_lima.AAC.1